MDEPEMFKEILLRTSYSPSRIHNADETCLFLKLLP
jgi:hypothetical protein